MSAFSFTDESKSDHRERRSFRRVELRRNGELVWTSKSRLGRKTTNREFITTKNLSVEGAKIVLPGEWEFAENERARLKLGIDFCDVTILDAASNGVATTIRLGYVAPSPSFIQAIERAQPDADDGRFSMMGLWT